jgi:hypothetical protein
MELLVQLYMVQHMVEKACPICNSNWTQPLREAHLALEPPHFFFCLRGLSMRLTSANPGFVQERTRPVYAAVQRRNIFISSSYRRIIEKELSDTPKKCRRDDGPPYIVQV